MNNPQLAKEINEEGSKLIIDTAFESGSINKNFSNFSFLVLLQYMGQEN